MKRPIFFSFIFICLSIYSPCRALDLDDGIDADDSNDDYYDMGKIQKNVNYIVRNAISKASTNVDKDRILIDDKYGSSKTASVSSIIVGEGSKVQGDIIIIDKSKGDKSAVSK